MEHSDNQNELFDVVDENDQVVEVRKRGEVHKLNLLHRAVHGFVFDSKDQIFLQKRSMSKDSSPGLWDSSFSGHVDAGESYNTAAVREAGEELGITLIHPLIPVTKIDACRETGHEFTQVYFLRNNGPFTLHPHEIESGKWVELPELEKWVMHSPGDFAPAFLCIYKTLADSLNSKGVSQLLHQPPAP